MPQKTLSDMSKDELKQLRSKLEAQIQSKGPKATDKEKKLLDVVHKMLDGTVATGAANKQHSVLGSHAQAGMDRGQYMTLNDIYEKGPTQVWYAKKEFLPSYAKGISFMHEDDISPPDPNNLERTHVHLGDIAEQNLKKIVNMMQGEEWSPNGEARSLIRQKHLSHTSMTVGDVIVLPDRTVMVDSHGGFYDLGAQHEVHEDIDYAAIIEGRLSLDEDKPMAFRVGAIVYSGSKSGIFKRFANDSRKSAIVELPNGELDVFPVNGLSLKKPGLVSRAKSWMIGEGFFHGQKVTYAGKTGKVVDYVRGDKTHLVVELPNGQMDSFPVAATQPAIKKVAEDFGSSDVSIAMQAMVDHIKHSNNGIFAVTPETVEQAADELGERFHEQMGCDPEEASRSLQHHFMMRLRSGHIKMGVDENIADAGSAGAVNADGAVAEASDIKMIKKIYFNIRGNPRIDLKKFGLIEDFGDTGEWFLPQYNTSGGGFDRKYSSCVRAFGQPYKVVKVG
jgi:hypothetical protein